MPGGNTCVQPAQAGMPFSTLDGDWPRDPKASGGVGEQGCTFANAGSELDRWKGFPETREAGVERGWMPKQRAGFVTQRKARQKKDQHGATVGARWIRDGAADNRNRIGPLKPHYMLVTERGRRPSIEARFTGYERLQDPHSEDGSGYKMPEMVSRTGNLDYGSFTLPAKSEMGKSTGLPVPLAKEDWGRATSVPPDFQRPERYGPPGKAKKRNQSNTKLAALPFTAHKDVYDTARWVGKEWVHPKGPGAPYFDKASWHNPKTMAHVEPNDYETTTVALSSWVDPGKWRKGYDRGFKRHSKNHYARAPKTSAAKSTERGPSPIFSPGSSPGSIGYAPQRAPTQPNFRDSQAALLRTQSGSWHDEHLASP